MGSKRPAINHKQPNDPGLIYIILWTNKQMRVAVRELGQTCSGISKRYVPLAKISHSPTHKNSSEIQWTQWKSQSQVLERRWSTVVKRFIALWHSCDVFLLQPDFQPFQAWPIKTGNKNSLNFRHLFAAVRKCELCALCVFWIGFAFIYFPSILIASHEPAELSSQV